MGTFARLGLPVVALGLGGAAFSLAGQGQNLMAILAGMGCLLAITVSGLVAHPMAGATIASAAGTGIAGYLSWQHVASQSGAHESICSISATLDCDRVNTSAWSEVLGLPTALWAAAFYAALMVVSWKCWKERPGYSRAPVLVLGSGLFAVLFSAFLAWKSSQLGAWCLFCIGLYGVSVLLLVAGVLGARDQGYLDHMWEVLLGRGDRSSGAALATATLLLLTGGVYAETHTSADHAEEQQEEYGIDALYAQTQGPLALTGKEPMYGRPSAPYTLVEFADYGCPHCAALSAPIKKLVARHPDLKLVHKHFVLSEASEVLARAALCAHNQGRFWEMHDILFANMGALGREDVEFIASRQLGLDADTFSACMEAPETRTALEADGNAGQTVGIHGTPSLFLGGVVPGSEWVQVVNGLDDAVELIVAAAERGDEMPAASPAKPHDHDH